MIEPTRNEPLVVVSRDGFWPTLWSWKVDMVLRNPWGTGLFSHHMSGMAITRNRAERAAMRAIDTAQAVRP